MADNDNNPTTRAEDDGNVKQIDPTIEGHEPKKILASIGSELLGVNKEGNFFRTAKADALDALGEDEHIATVFGIDGDYYSASQGGDENSASQGGDENSASQGGDKKLYFFRTRETTDILSASTVATTYLRLKAVSELVLGDSVTCTIVRGNTQGINLIYDKDLKTTPTMLSLSGIARDLKIKAVKVETENLYGLTEEEAVDETLFGAFNQENQLNLAAVSGLDLSYGSISQIRSDRIAKYEFLASESASPFDKPEGNKYASLTLIYDEEKESPEEINFSLSKDEDGLLENFYDSVAELKLDTSVLGDAYQANVYQYQRGKGKISLEKMHNLSRSVTFAEVQKSETYASGAKFTIIAAPDSHEMIYSTNTSNNYIRLVNSTQNLFLLDTSHTINLLSFQYAWKPLNKRKTTGVTIKDLDAEVKTIKADIKKSETSLGFQEAAIAQCRSLIRINYLSQQSCKLRIKHIDLQQQYIATCVKSAETEISDLKTAIYV